MENKKQTTIWQHNYIPYPTNTIVNMKNDLKNIIQTHYKKHVLDNTINEFKNNVCINNKFIYVTENSLTLPL